MILNETTALGATIKANIWKYLSLAVAWASPVHGLILFILLAIGVDTFLGRRAARLQARKEGKDERLEVTSKKTRIGFISKASMYIGLLILTLFLDKIMLNDLILYFFGDNFPIHFLITKGIGIIFLLIELDSVDEHVYKIKGIRIKDLIKKKISAVKKIILGAKKFKDDVEE